jgi:hypothetical protein
MVLRVPRSFSVGARNHCAKALTVNLSDSTKAAPYNAANTSASNLGLASKAP